METFVLSILGTDRPGLVEALASVVANHGGSWQDSHLTELAGMFAGVVLVHVPQDRSQAFRDALGPLRDRGLLDVSLREVPADDEASKQGTAIRLELVGGDRPGIVAEVSHVLSRLEVGIVDLRTWTESTAMAGGPLFRADAVVRLPDGVTRQDLTAALEDLSDDLMVDIGEA